MYKLASVPEIRHVYKIFYREHKVNARTFTQPDGIDIGLLVPVSSRQQRMRHEEVNERMLIYRYSLDGDRWGSSELMGQTRGFHKLAEIGNMSTFSVIT